MSFYTIEQKKKTGSSKMEDNQQMSNFDVGEFKKLLESQQMVDCTIGCEGGSISAHKIVLSACSSYLAKILNEHPVEHPIIILPELNIDDVKTLIHYMYTGELLKTSALSSASLFKTAAILCVNSINDLNNNNNNHHINNDNNNNNNINTNDNSSDEDEDNDDQVVTPELQNQSPLVQFGNNSPIIDSIINAATNYSMNVNNQIVRINNNNISNDTSRTATHEGPGQYNNTNINDEINDNFDDSGDNPINLINNNRQDNNNMIINNNNTIHSNQFKSSDYQFKCPVCLNDFQTICSFEYHMQRVHSVTQFGCEICHKPFASLRYVLTEHMRRCHGWIAEHKLHQC